MFKGIYVENLEMLKTKNNYYSDSAKETKKQLISSMKNLNSCYAGQSLNYLFSKISGETLTIDKITNIIESYSDILEMMKVYYQKQDYETSTMIKASNSELIREVEKK